MVLYIGRTSTSPTCSVSFCSFWLSLVFWTHTDKHFASYLQSLFSEHAGFLPGTLDHQFVTELLCILIFDPDCCLRYAPTRRQLTCFGVLLRPINTIFGFECGSTSLLLAPIPSSVYLGLLICSICSACTIISYSITDPTPVSDSQHPSPVCLVTP